MAKLSVGILACNNADDIEECLQSVAWADERIIILDTRSQDETADIALRLGARVVPHAFEDFARQREFGLSLAQHDWLFYLDSDERGTPPLAAEIRRVIEDSGRVGWWVPRRNFMWGHEIRHGGWYPDYQLRLLRPSRAHYDLTRQVHEIVVLDGAEGHLQEPLIHYNYRNMQQFVAKQKQYVAFEAKILFERGTRPKPWTFVSQPIREFWRRYIALKGYKDGLAGLVVCGLIAFYYGFVVTWRLHRLWRTR
ncbi:MAG: glycosyltransferase family 2 protein [Anaerolineae bacterium]|nr:glycosyltransferase family 2 protein [Anaerolineae bacterium]